jgi:hypothetical protein
MKVRLPRNRVVSTGAGSVSCRPRARPFSKAASHARTDPLGLELFGIAQRACSCTPPATAPLIIPQLRGASPGTRVEEIATVGTT